MNLQKLIGFYVDRLGVKEALNNFRSNFALNQRTVAAFPFRLLIHILKVTVNIPLYISSVVGLTNSLRLLLVTTLPLYDSIVYLIQPSSVPVNSTDPETIPEPDVPIPPKEIPPPTGSISFTEISKSMNFGYDLFQYFMQQKYPDPSNNTVTLTGSILTDSYNEEILNRFFPNSIKYFSANGNFDVIKPYSKLFVENLITEWFPKFEQNLPVYDFPYDGKLVLSFLGSISLDLGRESYEAITNDIIDFGYSSLSGKLAMFDRVELNNVVSTEIGYTELLKALYSYEMNGRIDWSIVDKLSESSISKILSLYFPEFQLYQNVIVKEPRLKKAVLAKLIFDRYDTFPLTDSELIEIASFISKNSPFNSELMEVHKFFVLSTYYGKLIYDNKTVSELVTFPADPLAKVFLKNFLRPIYSDILGLEEGSAFVDDLINLLKDKEVVEAILILLSVTQSQQSPAATEVNIRSAIKKVLSLLSKHINEIAYLRILSLPSGLNFPDKPEFSRIRELLDSKDFLDILESLFPLQPTSSQEFVQKLPDSHPAYELLASALIEVVDYIFKEPRNTLFYTNIIKTLGWENLDLEMRNWNFTKFGPMVFSRRSIETFVAVQKYLARNNFVDLFALLKKISETFPLQEVNGVLQMVSGYFFNLNWTISDSWPLVYRKVIDFIQKDIQNVSKELSYLYSLEGVNFREALWMAIRIFDFADNPEISEFNVFRSPEKNYAWFYAGRIAVNVLSVIARFILISPDSITEENLKDVIFEFVNSLTTGIEKILGYDQSGVMARIDSITESDPNLRNTAMVVNAILPETNSGVVVNVGVQLINFLANQFPLFQ